MMTNPDSALNMPETPDLSSSETAPAPQQTPTPPTSDPTQKTNRDKKIVVLIALVLLIVLGTIYFWSKSENQSAQSSLAPTPSSVASSDSPSPAITLLSSPTSSPLASPVPSVKFQGTIVDSFSGEVLPNLIVTLKANGSASNPESATTNVKGIFIFNDLPIGEYYLSAESPTHRLEGQTIEVGLEQKSEKYRASMINPKPSDITVSMYKDGNNNGIQDNGENTLDAQVRVVKIVNQDSKEVIVLPAQGKYSTTLPRGNYSLQPLSYTFFLPPPAKLIKIDGFGKPLSFAFGYKPTVSEGGLKIFAYDDKNSNSSRDDGEELVHYQGVRVTRLINSDSSVYAVPTEGVDISHLEFGKYYVVLDPESEAWRATYQVTDAGHDVDLQSSGSVTLYLGARKK